MKREYTHTPLEVAKGILSGKYTITSVYVLVNQIEDLTRERDEARAEVARQAAEVFTLMRAWRADKERLDEARKKEAKP